MNKTRHLFTVAVVLMTALVLAGCGGKSALTGTWEYESGVTRGKPESMELLKDGTGVVDDLSVTWTVENSRLVIKSSLLGLACNYQVSGSKLTLFYDDGTNATFVKR